MYQGQRSDPRHAEHPSRDVKVVGIGGAGGKTVTAWLIAAVLEAGDLPAAVIGSLGCCDGLRSDPPAQLGAEALEHWLRRAAANGCTHAILEIPHQPPALASLDRLALDTVCLTGTGTAAPGAPVRPAAPTGESPGSAFVRPVVQHLVPEGIAVLNADDPSCAGYLEMIDNPTLTVGIREPAEINATIVEQTPNEQTFLVTAGSETMPVRTTLVGTQNVYHCLLAAAVGLGHGLDLLTVARGLESVDNVPLHLERVEAGQAFSVFLDRAQTPRQLADALQTLRQVSQGRIIVVAPASPSTIALERARLGRVADRLADAVVVTTASRCENEPADIVETQHLLHDVLAGCRQGSSVPVVADREEAIRHALRQARDGDCVLIAGAAPGGAGQAGDRQSVRGCLAAVAPPLRLFRTAA
jgi:UDP-N-acetylmuramoyl-L-alanyl-D-glutamate--2,6-diaminopimelate ligase